MPRENTSEMAVLGMLALGARTGYDVRQACEQKLSHFWSESFGQIYPVLRRLSDRGWVERDSVGGGAGPRHEHTLTEEGRSALAAWIASPPQPIRVRNELLLKLFLGRLVDPEELRGLLRDHVERVRIRREQLLGIERLVREEADSKDAPYWLVTIDFGVRSLEAQRQWAEAALASLGQELPSGRPS